jgi:uncharacterized protein YukE
MEMMLMGYGLGINCKKVYNSGKKYIDYHNEIKDIQKELEEIASNINSIWVGVDGNNFTSSFRGHIKDLNLVINFLGSNGSLLENTAKDHGSIEDSFATEIERSDIEDEYELRDRY